MAEADRNKMKPQIAVMMVMVAVHVVGGVWCVVECGFLFLLLYISILFIFTIKFLPFRYFVSYFPYFPFSFFRLRAPSEASWLTRAHRVASVASGPAPCAGLK